MTVVTPDMCKQVGTLSQSGHLHTVLGRADGSSVAGHVVGDCTIFTTAEVHLLKLLTEDGDP